MHPANDNPLPWFKRVGDPDAYAFAVANGRMPSEEELQALRDLKRIEQLVHRGKAD